MRARFLFLILTLIFAGFYNPSLSTASKIDQIKSQIYDRNSNIDDLEKEIAKYQNEIIKVGTEKKTLNNEIYRLNLNRKKLSGDITLASRKINATNFEIETLKSSIKDKEKKIISNTVALSESIKFINESDNNSLVEMILSNNSMSDFLDSIESLQRFQVGLNERTSQLKNLKSILEKNVNQTKQKERELLNYRSELSDKKEIVEYNKKEKNQLLSVTKGRESNYKKILKEKQKLRDSFQKEIDNLETQLKITINPNSIPGIGSEVLAWPVNKVHITQFFGNTSFATQHSQVYRGHGHPGIDFRATIGTKIKAAAGGLVRGVGNTDSVPPKCYSYGKWVLIDHDDGLSTIYGHLSRIKVTPGQEVNGGDIIGYSGNTGYTTGPHLHFGVYATKGVKIQQFTKSINCKDKFIPIASLNAYLNPLSYLPKYK